jgi:hypothetical protein
VETDKVMYVLTEKTAAWNGTNTDMLCQPLAEMEIILHTIL